jgi:uncharacterized phage protein (TIGR01671 family)
MNREIKFKAWDNHGKKFIENEFAMSWCNGKVINIVGVSYNKHEEDDPYEDVTFCQYTGLLDKNGKEIYEGDVIAKMISIGIDEPKILHKGEVVFHYGGFCMEYEGYYFPLSRQHGGCEIIGNIYENPDLLK